MKKLSFIIATTLLLCSFNANAWWFVLFPIPSFSGSGDICLAPNFKVGDTMPSPIGKDSNAVVKSISGTSSRCKAPNINQSTVQFNINTTSKAAIDIPDDYQVRKQPLADLEKFNGTTLITTSKNSSNKGFVVFYRTKDSNVSPENIIQAATNGLTGSATLKDTETKNAEQLTINGMNAWRVEVAAKVNAVFGARVVYQLTLLEGDSEYIVINAYTAESRYEAEKEEMGQLASRVKNIKNDPNSQTVKSNESVTPVNATSTTPTPAAPLSNSQNVTPAPTGQDLKLTIEGAKAKCKAIGFTEKTEKFGTCVLELIK